MSDPKELLERRLRRAVDERETRGLHFFCQIGGRFDELGMTTLQISHSGRVLLGWRRQDDERVLFTTELTWDDQKHIYQRMLDDPFWSASPARRDGEDEETNIHLRFSDRGRGTYSSVHFWDTEMQQFPVLRRFMSDINVLVDGISEGEIPTLPLEPATQR